MLSSRLVLLAPAVLLLVSCGGVLPKKIGSNTDGPPSQSQLIKEDVSLIKAEPQVIDEPKSRYGNPSSYQVFGKTYRVMESVQAGYTEQGLASWYGKKFHGRLTSNREVYDMFALSAAHKSLPLPSYVRVTRLDNQQSLVLRVNDRGPFHEGRVIDLSWAAAKRLGITESGTAKVKVEVLTAETDARQTMQTARRAPVKTLQPIKNNKDASGNRLITGTSEKIISNAITATSALAAGQTVAAAAPVVRPPEFQSAAMAVENSPSSHAINQPANITDKLEPAINARLPKKDLPLMSANTPTVISNSLDGKSEEKYWLQLGAFSEKARAMALIKTLAKQNTEWPLFVEQSKKDQLWRVKLGPVKQSAQAEAYKQQLQAQGVSVHSVR
ncbi:hypothetical protein DC094_03480 [Pelagibaculum spongiae]|uniref:Endolytic peptidoglycan transglycosylase RlpA n=2 Tax=Pelagibaculum spongiae TaxID=2080658 RepID=A0A2V1H0T9_9GAMM|nr:hypothetical protein DC094_03480 [Pelagibaculum spongiae]